AVAEAGQVRRGGGEAELRPAGGLPGESVPLDAELRLVVQRHVRDDDLDEDLRQLPVDAFRLAEELLDEREGLGRAGDQELVRLVVRDDGHLAEEVQRAAGGDLRPVPGAEEAKAEAAPAAAGR